MADAELPETDLVQRLVAAALARLGQGWFPERNAHRQAPRT